MIVTDLMLCGGPATGGMWVERGHTYRVAREDLTVLTYGYGIAGPLRCGAARVDLATCEERRGLRRAERLGRDPRPWVLHEGRPIPRAPRYR